MQLQMVILLAVVRYKLSSKMNVEKKTDCAVILCLTLQQTCAVCLEEFRTRDELGVCPCSHAFHKK